MTTYEIDAVAYDWIEVEAENEAEAEQKAIEELEKQQPPTSALEWNAQDINKVEK